MFRLIISLITFVKRKILKGLEVMYQKQQHRFKKLAFIYIKKDPPQ